MRADRLLRLIVLLQRHGRMSAASLATALEVSERTVLRDMDALSTAGVPVYTERGRQGGCCLLDSFTTDASGLTTGETQALFAWTGHESAADLGLGAELAGALAKVAASASSGSVERGEALGAVLVTDRRRWFGEAERVAALPTLRQAAVAGRRVRMSYRHTGSAAGQRRTVDPWGLVDHSGHWYLIAAHRGQPRTYRVSRIEGVEALTEPARHPLDRDLATVWAELRGRFERQAPTPVTIEVSVAVDTARHFLALARSQVVPGTDLERFAEGAEAGEPQTRQAWRLTMRSPKSALAIALAWAPDVLVTSPPAFVDEIRAAADIARAAYRLDRGDGLDSHTVSGDGMRTPC